jgi:hypothetical protein
VNAVEGCRWSSLEQLVFVYSGVLCCLDDLEGVLLRQAPLLEKNLTQSSPGMQGLRQDPQIEVIESNVVQQILGYEVPRIDKLVEHGHDSDF